MLLAGLIATRARLLEVGLLDESVRGHMVCHSVVIYLHEVIVLRAEQTPTFLDATDYRPTLPTTDRPTDMRPHVPQHAATNHNARLPFCHGRCMIITVDMGNDPS